MKELVEYLLEIIEELDGDGLVITDPERIEETLPTIIDPLFLERILSKIE